MAKFETVLFDFDGTIADTLPLIYEAFNAALSPVLGRILEQHEIRAMFGPPDHQMIRLTIPAEHHESAIAKYVQVYQDEHQRLASAFPGMGEILVRCHEQGIKVGIVTGKSHETAEFSLEALGLADAYDVLVAGDDVERQKPDPGHPRAALAALGHKDGTPGAFVGDSAADMRAGRGAGLTTIAVTWGVPEHGDLLDANPDIVCDSVPALASALGIEDA
jgi:HAD superfamily hydrolase (TIGR01549 family)